MNQQLSLAIGLQTPPQLTDFCWGENLLLQQQITKTLSYQDERFLYIWGNSGSGKSHLLQGACLAMGQQATTVYLPLTVLQEWGPESLQDLDSQDLIAIDDIDAVLGQPSWEESIFHLYNRVKDNEHSILIITGKKPPALFSLSMPDLLSRLLWGLVLPLQELKDTEKIHVLQTQALRRGFILSTQVATFIVHRAARNMNHLQAILDILDKASLAQQRKITIPFAKSVLGI